MKTTRPHKVTLRAYQVGFGDCFLLTFHYSKGGGPEDRHLLIDFGTTARPSKAAPENLMLQIAKDVQETCKKGGGRLHAVVATHRHADHISGFALREGKESSGQVIRDCKPKYVIRPWTENPDADEEATAPGAKATSNQGTNSFRAQNFVAALKSMHEVAYLVGEEFKLPSGEKVRCDIKSLGLKDNVVKQLRFMSRNNAGRKALSNMEALKNLAEMGQNIYTFHGDKRAKKTLENLLPGVEVFILGPPTLEQSRSILRQRAEDDEQFWHLHGVAEAKDWEMEKKEEKLWSLHAENKLKFWESAALGGAEFWQLRVADSTDFWEMQSTACKYGMTQSVPVSSDLAASTAAHAAPAHARWFIRRMNSVRSEQMLEIVRTLDRVLNNTSLILLFKVGDQKLLFPGDAQWENWAYALKDERNKPATEKLLQDVTLYKVGHHGSLNATPKDLWKIIKPRIDQAEKDKQLWSVLSTKSGKHGKATDRTEVPRTPLVEELKKGNYFSTQQLKWGEEAIENKVYRDIVFEPVYKKAQPQPRKSAKRRTGVRRNTQG